MTQCPEIAHPAHLPTFHTVRRDRAHRYTKMSNRSACHEICDHLAFESSEIELSWGAGT